MISIRGTMPVIVDSGEKLAWKDSLCEGGSYSFVSDVIAYMDDKDGFVVSYGCDVNGYVTVEFSEAHSGTVDESMIGGIYEILESSYEKQGIDNVPVVFMWGAIPDEEGEVADENVQAPGFSSLMVVVGMLFWVRKKSVK